MDVGAKVEARDGSGKWQPGIVLDRYASLLDMASAVVTVRLEDGAVREFTVPADPQLSSDDLRLIKDDSACDVDDLTSLMELDESSILAALDARFAKNKIYTNTGTILLAVNPFQKLQGLYDRSLLNQYLQAFETRSSTIRATRSASLPPHIYQVAGEAYKAMLNGPNGMLNDQSILVSGESGSGKTESTKFLMQYLAQAGDHGNETSQSGIAAKVLQTNIILESFGNARTLRNDNSSRFGKFIKLHFTGSGRLTGASIQTYLLEKVRLVSQSKGERNYHIFYEMALGASAAVRERWGLDPPKGHAMPTGDYDEASVHQFMHYRYLNQSQCFKRRESNEDYENFKQVMEAMEVVGFTPFERTGIFDLVAAVMHIGNLTFEHDENQDRQSSAVTLSSAPTDLAPDCIWSRDAAARLLSVDTSQLERALSVRKIRAGTDFVSVKLSAEQANNARDALAKALYGRLFDWMVTKINEFLKMDDSQKNKSNMHFIGILDIFGFEVFPKNSFEQLCINFANETLQQQFNDYVFKMEQQEYEAQGVDWKYVEFLDNQDCVNLISLRPTGILPLIDEECLMPKGSDMTFASKLYRACSSHPRFSASRIQKAGGSFTIIHYAGNVEYSSVGFLEKNKDVLHQEAVDLLVYSPKEGSFTRTLCEGSAFRPRNKSSPRQRAAASKQRGASVGLQFKEQLTALLETLHVTNPHYVRCLKPNDTCEARILERDRVLNQLRCNGVMEAVRVARAGYPIRMPHEEFVRRYYSLKRVQKPFSKQASFGLRARSSSGAITEASMIAAEAKELLHDLLPVLPKEHDASTQSASEHSDQAQFASRCISVGLQMGFTKLFLKKATYDCLETMRTQRLRRHMVRIYHATLCFYARRRYVRFRNAVRTLQLAFRYKKQREQMRKQKFLMYRRKNARRVQAFLRMVVHRNKYQRFSKTLKMLQWRFRYRRMLAVVRQSQQQKEFEFQQQQKEQNQKQTRVLQYKDSYTASSDTSSEAPSLASNDVEGDDTSSTYSDDFYPYNDTIPAHLTTVNEQGNDYLSTQEKTHHFIGRPSQTIDNFRPIDAPPRATMGRMSRTYSDNVNKPFQIGGPHGSLTPHRASTAPQRKSSFRSTRSSRTVALPRLDVVQQTQWVNDEDRFSCHICNKRFSVFKRKHHCRACGEVICNSCSLYHRIQSRSMRVCVSCVAFHSLESPTSTASTGFSRLHGGSNHSSAGSAAGSRKQSTASSQFEVGRSSNVSGGLWLNAWPEPPMPDDEDERLACLRELNIRDLASSGKFNMYCEVAAKTMKCPIAYVSIIEDEEQILVANIGMAHTTLPRELSFCAHTICQPTVMVVLDTKNDERFRENPMVKGEKGAAKIRYYAGATIFSRDGHALGTVAVFDTKPRREADQEHIGMLQHLSFLASEKMTQSTIQEDSDSEVL